MDAIAGRRVTLAFSLFATVILGCGKPADSPRTGQSTQAASGSTSALAASSTQAAAAADSTTFTSLRAAFQQRNPRLEKIEVMDTRSAGERVGSVIVAHAIRADRNYSGDVNDEMFGVFQALPGTDTVLRPLMLFRTPSWLDYLVRIERIEPDSIVLLGKTSYTEDTRVVRWSAPDVERYVRPEDPWDDETVAFTDTLAMNLYDQPGGKRVPIDLHYEGALQYGMRVLEVRDNWFRVAVWSPWLPGCDGDPVKPVVEDTLWTPLADDKGRRLLHRYAPIC